MKETLCRGKRVDDGKWTEGYFFKSWNKVFLLWGMTGDSPNMEEVVPETVGQYTGIEDDNDVRIFEGDIVEVRYDDDTAYLTEVRAYGNTLCVDVDDDFDDYNFTAIDFAIERWREDGCELRVVSNIYDKNKDADASIEFLKAVDPLSVYHNF